MYTCLFEASDTGTSCFDPLLYHYPNIDDVYLDIGHTFIVADAIKVSPVLSVGISAFRSYFPNDKNGTWVSLTRMTDYVRISPKLQG
jgi:alpha-glucosidase (family GH31 glycosyl hydrolase)